MIDSVVFNKIIRSESNNLQAIQQFLLKNDLEIDESVQTFITLTHDNQILACGGLANNIIKCVAIDDSLRGEGVALKLITELIHLAYETAQTHLFIYTKVENESLFQQCGFSTLATVPNIVVLMENSIHPISSYVDTLQTLHHDGDKIGSIVMNANPFTLGHLHLVHTAAKQCDWLHLFVVKEENSDFSYQKRFELVEKGSAAISNLTLHHGSDYIISKATFPTYFIKDKAVIAPSYSEIDAKIFRHYLAPALKITHRFVGTEPNCSVTAEYNRVLQHWLMSKELPDPVIQLVEIERLQQNGEAISASLVREKIAQQDFSSLDKWVPPSTLEFLLKNRS